MRFQWPKSSEKHKKIKRLYLTTFRASVDQQSILRHYYMQNVKDEIEVKNKRLRKKF